jgi:hypothetical protein
MRLALLVIFIAGVATIVLFMGLSSMVVGGAYDRKHSGPLMNARVGLQLLAFLLVLLAVYIGLR